MKIITLLLTCFISLSIFGQNWCLDQTVWTYYTGNVVNDGTTNVLYLTDTVVDGQSCHKLEVRSDIFGYEQSYLYTYESNDTVFFYHEGYGFWPTYFFNAAIGDTIWHREPYHDTICQTVWPFIVDSVGTVEMMGDSLRYYRYTRLDTNLVHPQRLEVAEKLGAINDFMRPGATCLFNEEVNLYNLNCYEDLTLAFIKLIPHIDCEIISGIEGVQVQNLFEVHPNPATNSLYISIADEYAWRFQIMDYSGKTQVASEVANESTIIDIALLSGGIYLLKLQLDNGQYAIKRFIKE